MATSQSAGLPGSGGGCVASPASRSQWMQGAHVHAHGVSFRPRKWAGRVVAAAPEGTAKVAPAEKQASFSEEVMASEAKLLVGTYARAPVVVVSGKGCNVYDAEGKEYLDLAAGIAVNSLGHGDPVWVKAVADQAALLTHTSNLYHTVPQVKLAKRLVESSFADRVFFCNSGTEANEAAIKFARKFQGVKAQQGGPASGFVAFSGGFHGRTLGALALTSKAEYRAPFEPVMPGVRFAEFGDLEAAREAVRAGGIAGVFVEPVQGEGGVLPAVATFLHGLRELCDREGVLLIFDEVQCGLGRTGRLWAHEAYGVQPDMMTLAKPLAGGLPIGALLVTEAVAAAVQPGDHGSTFAGGPLVCAAALAVMDRLQEPGFLDGVASKGRFLKAKLSEAVGANRHVKEVRGTGLLVGLQLDVPAAPLVDAAREQGLLVITAGKGDVVRMAPPLTISELELEKAVSILAKCLPSLD